MRNLVWVIAALCFAMSGCSSEKATTGLIYEIETPLKLTDAKNQEYKHDLMVGPKGKEFPISVIWTSGHDESGCQRITGIKIHRQKGGNNSLIKSVKVILEPTCVMEFESNDESRFQVAVINMETELTRGIKKYDFRGTIATIKGNGSSFFEVGQKK
ncbi:hypothetical protein [Methylophilus sp. Leaf408]|uniref:hypothetical protein n=1 Tax=Methylophilus sp. Leaf408 TaxID=2876561 RepID=UPI001E4D1D53|nr:hypothetical protein [Methylophilus sp. Leaf408]